MMVVTRNSSPGAGAHSYFWTNAPEALTGEVRKAYPNADTDIAYY